MRCPRCGTQNRSAAKFCDQCGTALSLASGSVRPTAERRQLTVLFCDVVGSTRLAEQLDPEELRDVIRTYQQLCAEVVAAFDGYIAQYLGDGLLVYFGHPVAHEDDAIQAVRAGLRIVGAVQTSPLLKQAARPLRVRVGIHTGLVVVGEMGGGGRHEQLALGETPNIAARLQNLARPDTVVISGATARLVEGLCEWRDLGERPLRGLSKPIAVYQVIRESGVWDRFRVAVRRGLSPMVGRQETLAALLDSWHTAKNGSGQVVLLTGEPGIGKSRLVQELKERIPAEGGAELEFRCSDRFRHSAFYPQIEYFQRQVQAWQEERAADKLSRLETMLADHPFDSQEVIPLLAALLSIPLDERYTAWQGSPQRQKQRTQQAIVAELLRQAAQHPLLVVWEDIQWADPSTLDLLQVLIDRVPSARILVVLTFRSDFVPAWAMRPHMKQLSLSRLERQQAAQLIAELAGDQSLPHDIVQQVLDKTDGIPLFIEELTKMVLETESSSAASPLPNLAIPTTLRDLLMARLDRLGPAKEVAQLGAALGRAFPHEVIRAVWSLDDQALQHGLEQLAATEIISQRGEPPHPRWVFKHALIQDAAYKSLLKSQRLQLHEHIARVLEKRFPETAETQPELIAHHYTQAGLRGEALGYWKRAGQRAFERSAHVEALEHLGQGLALLKALPEGTERAEQELDFHTTRGPGLIATKGYADQEVKDTYVRAQELGDQIGQPSHAFSALRGLWVVHEVRGELQAARELGEQLLSMTSSLPDRASLIEVHRACGNTLFWLGEFGLAREHLEHAIALSQPDTHRALAFRYGSDPKVVCLSYNALALWVLGYPDQALEQCEEALHTTHTHLHSLATAQNWTAMLHQIRGDLSASNEAATAAIAVSQEQGFPHWLAMGRMLQGWAAGMQTPTGDGLAQIEKGLAAWRATGSELLRPYFLSLLAEVQQHSGQVDDGLDSLDQALQAVEEHGERFYEAELYRRKGELLLLSAERGMQNAPRHKQPQELSAVQHSASEACFQRAIDIARRQAARSLELRAAMSLGRLWQAQDRTAEARRLVAEVYEWFGPGLETPDLHQTRTLLERWADT